MDGTYSSGSGFIQSIPSLIQAFSGYSLAEQGSSLATSSANFTSGIDLSSAQYASSLALQGGKYSASVYNSYAQSALANAQYDVEVQQSNFNRQMDTLSRNITDISSKNQAIQGASGLSLGSKSYLAVSNQFLSNTERQIVQMRNTNLQTQNQLINQGQSQEQVYKNQATAALYQSQVTASSEQYQGQVSAAEAQYQGELAAYQSDLQASKGLTSSISSAISSWVSG